MTQIFKSNSKIKLFLFFLLAVVLTLGLSLSLQSVSASLLGAAGTSVHIGNATDYNLGNGQNLLWGELGDGSNGTGSFVLLQKNNVDKFRIDHNGNVNWSGTLQGGTVPWARLTSFPATCVSGQYVTAVGPSLTCAPAGGGTVTSVTATAPVASSGGTAPVISMAAATAAVNGYMTSAYASKLDGIAAGATVGITQAVADANYVNVTGDTMTGDLTVNKATPLINLRRTSGNPEIDLGDATNHWGIYNAYNDSNKLKFWYGSDLLQIDTFGNLTIAGTVDGIDISAKAPIWDAKAPTASPTFTGNVTMPGTGIWNSSGNVGIGITAPGYKLDVASGGLLTARLGTVSTDKVVIGGGAGKLTVGTIDPVFNINGEKYSTYAPDYAGGTRIETSGIVQLNSGNKYTINFDNLEKGSDLWLFWQASSKDPGAISVLLTSSFEGTAWYKKDGHVLIIYGSEKGEISYRLSAPRVDYKKWGNMTEDQTLEGINVSDY